MYDHCKLAAILMFGSIEPTLHDVVVVKVAVVTLFL